MTVITLLERASVTVICFGNDFAAILRIVSSNFVQSGGAKKLRHHDKKVYSNLIDDVSVLANHCLDEESWQVLLPLFRKK